MKIVFKNGESFNIDRVIDTYSVDEHMYNLSITFAKGTNVESIINVVDAKDNVSLITVEDDAGNTTNEFAGYIINQVFYEISSPDSTVEEKITLSMFKQNSFCFNRFDLILFI